MARGKSSSFWSTMKCVGALGEMLILSSFILVLCGLVAAAAAAVRIEIQPKQKTSATGSNLTISCTIVGDHSKMAGPKDLVYSLNGSAVSNREIEVMNSSTAVLQLFNLQRNMSGVIECKIPGEASDSMYLTVADTPRKPKVECRVYNWVNMSCFWDAQDDNGIQTNVTLTYNRLIEFDSSHMFWCPNYGLAGENSCSWLKDDEVNIKDQFMPTGHWILIYAKNEVGFDYDVVHFKPFDHVLPSPVANLQCNATSSQSGLLSWLSPSSGKNLLYRVIYGSKWGTNELNVSSSEYIMSLNLTRLSPYVEYSIAIDSIPLISETHQVLGHWSKNVTCHFRTHVSVPVLTPAVTSGGFLQKRVGNQRHVDFYWQPLDERSANGEVTAFRVKLFKNHPLSNKSRHLSIVTPSELSSTDGFSVPLESSSTASVAGDDERILFIGGSENTVGFNISGDVDYHVTVEARTLKGFNDSLIPPVVFLSKMNNTPSFPEMAVAMTDLNFTNRFYFNWSPVPMATGYTIFWCTVHVNRPDICLSSFSWEKINTSNTEHEVYLPYHVCKNVSFRLSVETMLPSGEEASSGHILFSSIYSIDGDVLVPQDVSVPKESSEQHSLKVTWMAPSGNLYCKQSAYISHYIIRYCSATTTCVEKIIDRRAESATLTELLPGTIYEVQIKSCSFDRHSRFTDAITASTLLPISYVHLILIIGSCSLAIVILIALFVIVPVLRRKCHKDAVDVVMPKPKKFPNIETRHSDYGPLCPSLPVLLADSSDPYNQSTYSTIHINIPQLAILPTLPAQPDLLVQKLCIDNSNSVCDKNCSACSGITQYASIASNTSCASAYLGAANMKVIDGWDI